MSEVDRILGLPDYSITGEDGTLHAYAYGGEGPGMAVVIFEFDDRGILFSVGWNGLEASGLTASDRSP